MIRHLAAVLFFAGLWLTTSISIGQVVLFRDDFDGPLADEWVTWNHAGEREVADGTYRLTPTAPSLMNAVLDEGFPDDISIRTSVRLLDDPEGFVFLGVVGRDILSDPGPNYYAGITTDDRKGIGISEGPVLGQLDLELDPTEQEIAMQFDLVQDLLFLTVWPADGTKPDQPQVMVEDSRGISGGSVGLSYNPIAVSNLATAAFGYLEIVGNSPCNLNRDPRCGVDDLDALSAAGNLDEGFEVRIGTQVRYDLNGDGVANVVDVEKWLSDAALVNGFSSAYLSGDTNLDGAVNATDLNALALSWRQTGTVWSHGDFTGEGDVDASDLNALALNWQAMTATVPEPPAAILSQVLVAGFVIFGRRMMSNAAY